MVEALRKMSTEELGRLYLFLTYLIKQTKYKYIARDKNGRLLLFSKRPTKVEGPNGWWIVTDQPDCCDQIYDWVERSMFGHIPVEWEDDSPTPIERMVAGVERLDEEWDNDIICGSIPIEVKLWGYRYV